MTDSLSEEKLVWFLTECCDRLIQSTTRFCPACGWECRVKALHEQRYPWGMP